MILWINLTSKKHLRLNVLLKAIDSVKKIEEII